MSYKNFITKLFNVNPSDLLKVTDTDRKDGSIILKIRLVAKYNLCPICRTSGKIHAYYKRELKHSTFSNRPCIICYEQRRYICPECSTTFSEPNPFIDTSERVTYEAKIVVLKDLKHPEATYTAVANRYNLSPTKVMRIFDKHVDIARKPLPRVLSIDEHYFPNSDQNSKYCCLLMDFETGVMLDILPDRKKNYQKSVIYCGVVAAIAKFVVVLALALFVVRYNTLCAQPYKLICGSALTYYLLEAELFIL